MTATSPYTKHKVYGWLREHPRSTIHEIMVGVGYGHCRNRNHVYGAVNTLRKEGLLERHDTKRRTSFENAGRSFHLVHEMSIIGRWPSYQAYLDDRAKGLHQLQPGQIIEVPAPKYDNVLLGVAVGIGAMSVMLTAATLLAKHL